MTAPNPLDAEHAALALSQAEHHAATAYDALLAVSPLALTPDERADLDRARGLAGELHRAIAARRGARALALHGPPGPPVRGQ